jgi:hypothetical protein
MVVAAAGKAAHMVVRLLLSCYNDWQPAPQELKAPLALSAWEHLHVAH